MRVLETYNRSFGASVVSESASLPLRIAVVGPESCGKTTLVAALSERCVVHGIAAAVIAEYARDYYRDRPYCPRYDDIEAIARGQLAAERVQASDHDVLLCDTTVLTCMIWADVAFGRRSPDLLALHRPGDYALTLLTRPDIPWQPDPLRSHPLEREALWHRYREELDRCGIVAVDIAGTHEQRVETAWRALRRRMSELPII